VTCAADPSSIAVPVLIPDEIAQQWLERDPSVRSAQSDWEAAQAEASQLEASPYEWTSRLAYQERNYEHGANSHEWNVGLERQVRLPAKRNADRAMAGAVRTTGAAQFNIARRQAAQDLLDLWLDWSAAHAIALTLAQQRHLARDNLEVVNKRVQRGDAARLEQRLAEADVNDLEGNVSAANTTEQIAKLRLLARFSVDLALQATPLPEPMMPPYDAAWWRARILAASVTMNKVQSELAQAEIAVSRAQAERLPDPTLGVYAASEARGDEDIIGGTISIPFPGERRNLEIQRQLALANAARDRRLAVEMEAQGVADTAFAAAQGAYMRWQLASAAVVLHRDNADLAQKAYVLGEQELQTLLLARRQALSAAEVERQSRAEAIRAYGTLLLHANLLWQNVAVTSEP
jgi:outer membrane protein TolC